MKFELDIDELVVFNEWNTEHKKSCEIYNSQDGVGAIGGRISYNITVTGLGIITKAICCCGEEIDLTDYTNW